MKKQAFNPYLPSYEYIPDGEPYVFDGRVYVFGSHDRFGAMSFCENHYVTWSADVNDLSDWRYEGVIFRRDQDPLNPEGKHPLFAPDVQKGADGKFYLYYAPAGTNSIGVAVSDTPGGRYEFLGHITNPDGSITGRRERDPFPFDPGAFLDDDGQVYVYFGFDPFMDGNVPDSFMGRKVPAIGPYAAKLMPDMFTMAEEAVPLTISGIPNRGHDFFEASSMRKINGRYYFIYSSQNSHELCYALGDSPLGPFEYGGVLLSNGDIGLHGRKAEDRVSYTGNNHGSLVEINGQWYIFGHRMTNYTAFSRQGIAEPVTIKEDGSIDQVEITSCGLNGGPLSGKGSYEARIACGLISKTGAVHYDGASNAEKFADLRRTQPVFTQDGEDRECDPDQYIANMQDGAEAGYKYFEMEEPFRFAVTTRGSAGLMQLSLESRGPVIAEVLLREGENWHDSTISREIYGISGKQALYFAYKGEGRIDFRKFRLEQ